MELWDISLRGSEGGLIIGFGLCRKIFIGAWGRGKLYLGAAMKHRIEKGFVAIMV